MGRRARRPIGGAALSSAAFASSAAIGRGAEFGRRAIAKGGKIDRLSRLSLLKRRDLYAACRREPERGDKCHLKNSRPNF